MVTNAFFVNGGLNEFSKGNDVSIPNPDYPQDIKVVTGKNKVVYKGINSIDTRNFPDVSKIGITIKNEKGYPIVNGTSTAAGRYNNNLEEFTLLPGKYTMFVPQYSTNGIAVTISLGYNNKVITGWSINNKTENLKTITLKEELTVNQLRMWFGEGYEFENYEMKIMLIEGEYTKETIPDYEPYIEPKEFDLDLTGENYNYELAGTGEYKDCFFKNEKTNPNYNAKLDENEWYLKQNIAKYIFNGSENWQKSTTKTLTQVFRYDVISTPSDDNLGLCNYFIMQEGDTEKFSILKQPQGSNLYFAINKSTADTVEEFKTWLSNHNVVLYYPLQTSEYIKIPKDITPYQQLEELNKYIGQGGTIVIETESEEENAQLIVKASALASFENS